MTVIEDFTCRHRLPSSRHTNIHSFDGTRKCHIALHCLLSWIFEVPSSSWSHPSLLSFVLRIMRYAERTVKVPRFSSCHTPSSRPGIRSRDELPSIRRDNHQTTSILVVTYMFCFLFFFLLSFFLFPVLFSSSRKFLSSWFFPPSNRRERASALVGPAHARLVRAPAKRSGA